VSTCHERKAGWERVAYDVMRLKALRKRDEVAGAEAEDRRESEAEGVPLTPPSGTHKLSRHFRNAAGCQDPFGRTYAFDYASEHDPAAVGYRFLFSTTSDNTTCYIAHFCPYASAIFYLMLSILYLSGLSRRNT